MTTNEKKTGDADDNELGMDAARDRAAAEPTPPTEPDDVAVGLDVLFTVVIAGPGGAHVENVKTERDITRQNYLAWNNGSGVNGRTRRGAVMRLAVSREWDVLAIVEHGDTVTNAMWRAGAQVMRATVVARLRDTGMHGAAVFVRDAFPAMPPDGDLLPDDPAADGSDKAHPAWWRGRESKQREAAEVFAGLRKELDDAQSDLKLRRQMHEIDEALRAVAEEEVRMLRLQRNTLERDLAARTVDLRTAQRELDRGALSRADDLIMAKMHAHHAEHAAHCDGGCFTDVRATLDAARDVIADHLGRQTVTAAPSTATVRAEGDDVPAAGRAPSATIGNVKHYPDDKDGPESWGVDLGDDDNSWAFDTCEEAAHFSAVYRAVVAKFTGRGAATDDAEGEPEDDKAPTRAELLERLDMTFRQLQVMVELVDLGMDDAARTTARTMRAVDNLRHPADALKMDDADKVAGSRWVLWCASYTFASMLDAMGVENFAQWAMTMPDGRKLDLTAQWQGKVSAVERLRVVTEERDAVWSTLLSAAEALNGERPAPETGGLAALARYVDGQVLAVRAAKARLCDALGHYGNVTAARAFDDAAERAKALGGYRKALLDVAEALDGERPVPDFDAPAELGAYIDGEVKRLRLADCPDTDDDRDADAVTAVGAPCAYCGAEPGEDCAPTCDVAVGHTGES